MLKMPRSLLALIPMLERLGIYCFYLELVQGILRLMVCRDYSVRPLEILFPLTLRRRYILLCVILSQYLSQQGLNGRIW